MATGTQGACDTFHVRMTAAAPQHDTALHRRITALFLEHVDAVFNVSYRVVWNKDDVEDVVQATFLKAFTRLDQLERPDRVRPWLLQIAYRESIAVIRRRRELPTDPQSVPEEASVLPQPDDVVVGLAVADAISQALERLDPDERMAVVLRDVEELPMREVAEVLDVGLSAAKMRVHRGRQALRVALLSMEITP